MRRGELAVRMRFADSEVKRIAIGCVSDRGAREYQEDSFGFSSVDKAEIEKYGFAAVVADGMGGLADGGRVSAYVVSEMLAMQKRRDRNMPVHLYLSRALVEINRNVQASGVGGGSTAVVILCTPEGIHWCTAGDSRVYLCRDSALTLLNEDGDYMNNLMDRIIAGDLTFDEAGEDAQKDSLAQYIGCRGTLTPDVNAKPLIPRRGDKLLLCTDGVYNALTEEELCAALSAPAGAAAEAVKSGVAAKGYAHQDNFTAVVLEFTR